MFSENKPLILITEVGCQIKKGKSGMSGYVGTGVQGF